MVFSPREAGITRLGDSPPTMTFQPQNRAGLLKKHGPARTEPIPESLHPPGDRKICSPTDLSAEEERNDLAGKEQGATERSPADSPCCAREEKQKRVRQRAAMALRTALGASTEQLIAANAEIQCGDFSTSTANFDLASETLAEEDHNKSSVLRTAEYSLPDFADEEQDAPQTSAHQGRHQVAGPPITGDKSLAQQSAICRFLSPARTLMVTLGGLQYSTSPDEGDMWSSQLGQVYLGAMQDGFCDVLVIDPVLDEHDHFHDHANPMRSVHILQRRAHDTNATVWWECTKAEEADYSTILSDPKYLRGGVCFIIDIRGAVDHLWEPIRALFAELHRHPAANAATLFTVEAQMLWPVHRLPYSGPKEVLSRHRAALT